MIGAALAWCSVSVVVWLTVSIPAALWLQARMDDDEREAEQ